ncbi:MAG TPA: sodium/solute symporter, partial [Cytophagaceae bacterium]
MHASFQLFDIAIIVVYFILTFVVGFHYSKDTKNSSQYFLAGRHTGWVVIGASLFATNVSSEHFVGLAGTGFQGGMAAGNYEFMGALTCILLAWTFGPLYLRNGVFTAPEFIGKRFNNFCRVYLSVGSIIAYILTKISMMLLAGGIFLAKVVGLDIYTSAIILVIATGIYTVSGGFSSVIYTGAVQAVIMIVGAIVLAGFGYHEVGGVQALWHKIPAQDWQFIKPITDANFPWTGLVFGMPIVCIWYHCTDQFFLHKFLASKDIPHAQAGTIFTAYLKLIPVFTLLIPGLIARVLYPSISADDAYPTLVTNLLPIGLKGLVIAAFLGALMSSLSSCFSSCSTLF